MLEKPQPFDVVIVGGGVTGAGVARDAALRGMRVALFEKDDFASGTSSKSSKLIHGGFRYLEHGEIGLVFESVSERHKQSRLAPHIVRPMPFLLPVYQDSRVGLETLNVGMWLYDALALFRSHKLHKTFRGKKARDLEPQLRADGLTGAIRYYDCFTDDARLVLENILGAEEAGAVCKSYSEVTGLVRERGRIASVRVRDRITGVETSHETRSLILATGPWTDGVIDGLGVRRKTPILRPTKGVHLVFPREKLPLTQTVTCISPIDGRVTFAIPWRDRTVLGTTDTDFEGDPDEVHASRADAEYLCSSANYFFPSADFRPSDVIATWAGLRPLVHDEAESASDVSREHQIYTGDDGVLLIAGGKLTTYRIMARDCVDATLRWLRDNHSTLFEGRVLRRRVTESAPLPGARGLPRPSIAGVEELAESLTADSGIDEDLIRHLAFIYGTRAAEIAAAITSEPQLGERIQPDLPHVWAEVEHAAVREKSRTLDDVFSRRVPLLLIGREQGLDVAERAARMIAELRGWDSARIERELDAYRATVERSRRFRAGAGETAARVGA